MLTSSLINHKLPRLTPEDTVARALQLITDYSITHLPVIEEGQFLGMICEEDLRASIDYRTPVKELTDYLLPASVKQQVHFLNAVGIAIMYEANVVAVVREDGHFEGLITSGTLIKVLGHFAGANETGGIIVMEMERSQYSISKISHIAEDNNCIILHLNTTVDPTTGILSVTLHINKTEIGALINAFERYDYNVVYYLGKEDDDHEVRSNYKHLMNYLEL